MDIRGDTILSAWMDSIQRLVDCHTVVPTERNLDTYEEINAVITVEHPLQDLDDLLAFEKSRGHIYSESKITDYWKIVNKKLKLFPHTKAAQLDVIFEKLSKSPWNRHGYASIWVPDLDTVSPYPSCIIGVYFFIRDDKLNMTSILRSNDAWGQALNDMYELVMIQKRMAERLQIKVGKYSHFAMSYHLYTKDRMEAAMFLKQFGDMSRSN